MMAQLQTLQHKRSYGLCLIKWNESREPQILLIQHRYTYAYYEFVCGYYKNPQPLLNKMTLEEKVDILSHDFDILWYKLWFYIDKLDHKYIRGRAKFNSLQFDNLDQMIIQSPHIDLQWEPPKGRPSHSKELPIATAIREFIEETGCSRDQLTIQPGVQFSISLTSAHITYTTQYFVATTNSTCIPAGPYQTKEVSAVAWHSLSTLNRILPQYVNPLRIVLRKLKNKRKSFYVA